MSAEKQKQTVYSRKQLAISWRFRFSAQYRRNSYSGTLWQ